MYPIVMLTVLLLILISFIIEFATLILTLIVGMLIFVVEEVYNRGCSVGWSLHSIRAKPPALITFCAWVQNKQVLDGAVDITIFPDTIVELRVVHGVANTTLDVIPDSSGGMTAENEARNDS